MANHHARLQVVERAQTSDTVFKPTALLFVGDDDEDLLCGACGAILGKGVSRRTAFVRFATESGRALIECPRCAAMNVIKTTKPTRG